MSESRSLHHDGTDQSQRTPRALDPSSFLIDDATLGDRMALTAELVKGLRAAARGSSADAVNTWSTVMPAEPPLEDARELARHWASVARSLEARSDSPPHVALFLAFLKLLRHPQDQLNAVTKRQLDFYYREVLRFHPKPATPDRAYVLFHLAKGVKQHRIEQGTELDAGKDEQGNDRIYRTDEEIVVNRARVESLKSVLVGSNGPARVYAADQGNAVRAPAIGFCPGPVWDAFGKDQRGLPPEARTMNAARLGFAVASPLLCLREGQRDVTLHASFRNNPQAISFAGRECLLAWLSGEKAWIGPLEVQTFATSSVAIDANSNQITQETILLNVRLASDRPAVVPYRPAVLGTAFDTPWPVLRIELDTDRDEHDFAALSSLRNLRLQVSVAGLTPKTVRNESGTLVAKGPFDPFGSSPTIGSALYVGDPELQSKPVKSITLRLPWAGVPASNMGEYYAAYRNREGLANESFRARISEREDQAWKPMGEQSLFAAADATEEARLHIETGYQTANAASELLKIEVSAPAAEPVAFGHEEFVTLFPERSVRKNSAIPNLKASLQVTTAQLQATRQAVSDGARTAANAARAASVSLETLVSQVEGTHGNAQLLHTRLVDVANAARESSENLLIDFVSKQGRRNDIYPQLDSIRSEHAAIAVAVSQQRPVEYATATATLRTAVAALASEQSRVERQLADTSVSVQRAATELGHRNFQAVRQNLQMIQGAVGSAGKAMLARLQDVQSAKRTFDEMQDRVADAESFATQLFSRIEACHIKLQRVGMLPPYSEHLRLVIEDHLQVLFEARASWREWLQIVARTPQLFIETTSQIHDAAAFTERTLADLEHRLAETLTQLQRSETDWALVLPNPPYTPRLQSLAVEYSASAHLSFDDAADDTQPTPQLRLFHLEPFGANEVHASNAPADGRSLLPSFADEGYLFIGVADVQPPQVVKLLFQVAECTGNPAADLPPAIRWGYLAANEWKPLDAARVEDQTRHFTKSGVISFAIPEDADTAHQRMPNGCVWLRAAIRQGAADVCRMIDIRAQAVSATFVLGHESLTHLEGGLPAESITNLKQRRREIKRALQPFASSGGRAPESDSRFYTRVSERLRHKNRAVSRWDYERMVLDAFPDVYKVECLPHFEPPDRDPAPGHVTLVVVPRLPHEGVLQPRASRAALREIEEYIAQRCSPFLHAGQPRLHVRTAEFEPLTVLCRVQFQAGKSARYYQQQLEQELIRFLSPWSFGDVDQPALGNSIHRSVIEQFIRDRPYVDFFVGFRLIHRRGNNTHPDQTLAVAKPQAILVSAEQHIILPIDDPDDAESVNTPPAQRAR